MVGRTARLRVVRNVLLLLPGIAGDLLLHSDLLADSGLHDILGRFNMVYITIIAVLIFNSILTALLSAYEKTDLSKRSVFFL